MYWGARVTLLPCARYYRIAAHVVETHPFLCGYTHKLSDHRLDFECFRYSRSLSVCLQGGRRFPFYLSNECGNISSTILSARIANPSKRGRDRNSLPSRFSANLLAVSLHLTHALRGPVLSARLTAYPHTLSGTSVLLSAPINF